MAEILNRVSSGISKQQREKSGFNFSCIKPICSQDYIESEPAESDLRVRDVMEGDLQQYDRYF
ncbi:MAG: hypothetical protein V8R80_12090 [Eubacterium sp.]